MYPSIALPCDLELGGGDTGPRDSLGTVRHYQKNMNERPVGMQVALIVEMDRECLCPVVTCCLCLSLESSTS